MTKREKERRVKNMSPEQAKKILHDIVVGCIHEGRPMMTSVEILDEICTTLRGWVSTTECKSSMT